MIPEYFQNKHGRHIGKADENILNMHTNILNYRIPNRTASMLLEHTEWFPNMIRSLSEHPNFHSASKRNDTRASVIAP
jgi:hypothetical protein